MSLEANKQTVREFFEAISAGDPGRAFSLLSEDIAWTIIGDTPVSRTFHGHKDCQENLLEEGFRQFKPGTAVSLEVVETIAEGDKVVARVEGKIEGKFGPYNNTYCHVFTIRGGKIAADIEYLDTTLIHKSWYGRTIS